MGLFDRLRNAFGRVGGAGVDLAGPLRLAAGDRVAYYRETWTVDGVRVLVADDLLVHHYLLRATSGEGAVLVAEAGADLELALERTAPADDPEIRSAVAGAADATLLLRREGQARAWIASHGATTARQVVAAYRHYGDAEGDSRVSVEDFGGVSESRRGEPVLETEFQFVRASDDAPAASTEGDDVPEESGRPVAGSPLAAARALVGAAADDAPAPAVKADAPAREDAEPAYTDDGWDDEAFQADAATAGPEVVLDAAATEADAWTAATAYIRGLGTRSPSADAVVAGAPAPRDDSSRSHT